MMSKKSLISLGAINKISGEYVYPKIANKKDKYVCPDCEKDLILCQGEIKVHHFRHHIESINPCNYYNSPTESQIHKDAKMLIKVLLEKKIPISFIRNCVCCKCDEETGIPEMTETSSIQLEYRFEYNGLKIADIAYIDDNELVCIFEICNSHKTHRENRPEPWFEVDALSLLTLVNKNEYVSLKINCIRREQCDDCIEKINNNRINELKKIKNNRINELKKMLEIRNDRSFDDDTAGDFSSMRHMNQQYNHRKSVNTLICFETENIEYIEGNNVITIFHPISKIKIRRSLINDKTFYSGKWSTNMKFNDIIEWYRSFDGEIIECHACCGYCYRNNYRIICKICGWKGSETCYTGMPGCNDNNLCNHCKEFEIQKLKSKRQYYHLTRRTVICIEKKQIGKV
jgi:uncharacterized protein YkuJ